MKPFLTAAEVAARLGLNGPAALHRRRPQLDAAGFPAPLPFTLFRRSLGWRASEVDAWLSRQGLPGGAAPEPQDLPPGVVRLDTARLERMARTA